MPNAKVIETIDIGNTLGEGVLWRETDSTVWWTDIKSSCLYRLSWPDLALKRYEAPGRIGCFAFLKQTQDWLLIACEANIGLFQPETGETIWIAKNVPGVGNDMRFNDGRVDNAGRFWAGSMLERPGSIAAGERPGAFYRLGPDGVAQAVVCEIHITNGLCWSPRGDLMFFADSPTGQVWRAPYDNALGTPGRFEPFATFSNESPDGAVTDSDGNYWCALWGGGRVAQIDTSGRETTSIELPASQPSCLAFGGPNKNLLFVTSAKDGLSRKRLKEEPFAGSLFVVETNSTGLAAVPADYPAIMSVVP